MFRELVPQNGEILVVKTVDKNRRALHGCANGFQYPESDSVEAPDWEPTFTCGGGLHGLPWCAGDRNMLFEKDSLDTVWCVMRVKTCPENYLSGKGDLLDKCKFRRAEDVSFGTREEVIANVLKYVPKDIAVHFAMQTAGDDAMQKAGDFATQKAGHRSTQTAGYESTQKAGYRSTQKAGYESTQKAGDFSTQTAGDDATQTAGIGTVQISRWYDGKQWVVSTRVITEEEADKWYYVEKGVWRLCAEDEIGEAEKK